MGSEMKISFVIPCYRSENTLITVVDEIRDIMKTRMQKNKDETYEIVLVNDYSPDNVWSVIKSLSEKYSNIVGVSFARNFGQHSALMAGYSYCTGDYIVSLDDDGQTPLDSLDKLFDKIEDGYDVAYAYYREIKQNLFRKMGSWMAGKMGQICLGMPKDLKMSSFFIAKSFVIKEILDYKNSFPYLPGLVLRVTRNISCVETEHRSRISGTSGYSFRSLLSLWLNGFTAFSVKPLEFSTYFGFFTSIVGFIYALFTIIRKILNPTISAGWSSTISILLITSGIIMIMLGLIGEYIGRIYICINSSPQYVIKEVTERKGEAK